MFGGKGLGGCVPVRAALAITLAGLGSLTPGLDPSPGARSSVHAAGSADTLEPYAWGSVQTGTSAHLAWGSPVVGDGTLTTTRPSGGGSLGAAVTAGAPDTKLSSLIAFGGGEVVAFAERLEQPTPRPSTCPRANDDAAIEAWLATPQTEPLERRK
jgi:hypothetical protein